MVPKTAESQFFGALLLPAEAFFSAQNGTNFEKVPKYVEIGARRAHRARALKGFKLYEKYLKCMQEIYKCRQNGSLGCEFLGIEDAWRRCIEVTAFANMRFI